MIKFEDYAKKYSHIRMDRQDGILEITFHTDGGTLVWGGGPHGQFGPAFHDIGQDRENKIVIMTGTGDAFIEEINSEVLGDRLPKSNITPTTWDHIYSDAKRLLMNLLDIEVPVIAAVNGPVNIHAELAVLSDIVLASDHAAFADAPHFPNGLVPGDGVHVIWPYLLGKEPWPLFPPHWPTPVGPGGAPARRGQRGLAGRQAAAARPGVGAANSKAAPSYRPLRPSGDDARAQETHA